MKDARTQVFKLILQLFFRGLLILNCWFCMSVLAAFCNAWNKSFDQHDANKEALDMLESSLLSLVQDVCHVRVQHSIHLVVRVLSNFMEHTEDTTLRLRAQIQLQRCGNLLAENLVNKIEYLEVTEKMDCLSFIEEDTEMELITKDLQNTSC